jgi:hypothetical protein
LIFATNNLWATVFGAMPRIPAISETVNPSIYIISENIQNKLDLFNLLNKCIVKLEKKCKFLKYFLDLY